MTYCLNLRQLCHERDELRATSSSLTVELQQAAVGIPVRLMMMTIILSWMLLSAMPTHCLFMATRAFLERSHGWEFNVILEGL